MSVKSTIRGSRQQGGVSGRTSGSIDSGIVANMEASLHGRSILGSRDTAAYIQDRGYLEQNVGLTEYDVMVGRCMTRFFHRYNRFYVR